MRVVLFFIGEILCCIGEIRNQVRDECGRVPQQQGLPERTFFPSFLSLSSLELSDAKSALNIQP